MELELKVMQALRDDEKKNDNEKKRLAISKGAFAKAMLYAKLVTRIAGGGMECYGYLLKDKNSLDDNIIDIHFADEQDTSSGPRMTRGSFLKRIVTVVTVRQRLLLADLWDPVRPQNLLFGLLPGS